MWCIIPGDNLVRTIEDGESAVIAAVIASEIDVSEIVEAGCAKGADGVYVGIRLKNGKTRTRRIGSDGKVSGKHGDIPAALAEWLDG
jgi:3-dehydroquinate synthase class II